MMEDVKINLSDIEKQETSYLDLAKIGVACGKMAQDIYNLHKDLEKVLFVVPLRGGLPIWKGVSYGFVHLKGECAHELNVVYLPATSIVQNRDDYIKDSISSLLKKQYDTKGYESIVIVDEAISGSSSKMVFDNVKRGVKEYSKDKDWVRFYWKKLPVELYLLASDNGHRLNPRIQKLSNVLIYPIDGSIITTDDSSIYPIEYITEIGRIRSRKGGVHPVVKPDILFNKNTVWSDYLKEIEKGVDAYFLKEKH